MYVTSFNTHNFVVYYRKYHHSYFMYEKERDLEKLQFKQGSYTAAKWKTPYLLPLLSGYFH